MHYNIHASLNLKLCIMQYVVGAVLHRNNTHCSDMCAISVIRVEHSLINIFL